MDTYDRIVEKWAPVLNEETAGKIEDQHRRRKLPSEILVLNP